MKCATLEYKFSSDLLSFVYNFCAMCFLILRSLLSQTFHKLSERAFHKKLRAKIFSLTQISDAGKNLHSFSIWTFVGTEQIYLLVLLAYLWKKKIKIKQKKK